MHVYMTPDRSLTGISKSEGIKFVALLIDTRIQYMPVGVGILIYKQSRHTVHTFRNDIIPKAFTVLIDQAIF